MPIDEFGLRYSDPVTGSCDCVDRIVLNAFFPLGHNPRGGLRTWRLYGDAELNNTHLMRKAGQFTRRGRRQYLATRQVGNCFTGIADPAMTAAT